MAIKKIETRESVYFTKTGKRHTIKNIGKTSVVINYTRLSNGLIVKNQQIRPGDTITIFYQTGTFYTASQAQIQTIEIKDVPEKGNSKVTEITTNNEKEISINKIITENIQTPILPTESKVEEIETCRPTLDTQNIPKKTKILLATTFWKRYYIFEKFISHHKKLGLDILVIGSEGKESKDFCESLGCTYIEHPNTPFGSKLNRRVDYFLEHDEYTHILFLGSDNFIDQTIYNTILKNIEKYDMISWSDLYYVDDLSGKMYYSEGYKHDVRRKGEPIAPGRCISKKVIRELRGQLWDQYVQRAPDFHVWLKLKKVQKQIILSCKEIGGVIMDVKTDQNLNSFASIEKQKNIFKTDKIETEKIIKICLELNLSFIKKNTTKYKSLLKSFTINDNKYPSIRQLSTVSKNLHIEDIIDIYENQSFSYEIFNETGNNSEIKFSQVLPLFRASDIGWLVLESLCRQENINFNWELIIIEENLENFFGWDKIQDYIKRLSEVGCKRIKYVGLNEWIPLSSKWFFLVQECSDTSEIIGPNSADIYCHKNRLRTQYDALINSEANWYKLSSNIVYDITQNNHVKFISPNPNRSDTSSSASKIFLWKNLPLDNVKINVDGWRYNTMNQKNEIKYYYDESSDLMNGTINVNGLNNLSLKRGENIMKVIPPLHKCCDLLENHLPHDISHLLKGLITKIDDHKKILENSEINLRKWK